MLQGVTSAGQPEPGSELVLLAKSPQSRFGPGQRLSLPRVALGAPPVPSGGRGRVCYPAQRGLWHSWLPSLSPVSPALPCPRSVQEFMTFTSQLIAERSALGSRASVKEQGESFPGPLGKGTPRQSLGGLLPA